jgi:hypothetical protein
MKNFDKLCRGIDWSKMAKARISVKNLAEKKPSLKYLGDFLDALAESAVEVHNVKLSEVYPKAGVAGLISEMRKKEALDNVSKRFFKAQNERREKENL